MAGPQDFQNQQQTAQQTQMMQMMGGAPQTQAQMGGMANQMQAQPMGGAQTMGDTLQPWDPSSYTQAAPNPTTPGGPGYQVPPGGAPSAGAIQPPPPGGIAPGQHTGPNDPFAPVPPVPPPEGGIRNGVAQTASAGPADYQGVQGFADQAYQQARRNIDPMQEQASRRMSQDLVNKGIDPSSPQGMAMLDQQNRNFTDQNNAATFGALQFGQGIQNQMFGQSAQNAQMLNQMTGMNIQADVAGRGQDVTKYGMDQQQALGMGALDMSRQGQEHGQMMDLATFDRQGNQYTDALTMSLMGQTPVPGVMPYDPSGFGMGQMQNTQNPGWFS